MSIKFILSTSNFIARFPMRDGDTAFFAFINIKNSTKMVRISLVDTGEGCRPQRIEAFSLT